jgi:hypothetical protein
MSKNKYWREQWIKVIYARAVSLFHEQRKLPENAETPMGDLARQCANTVFADAANTIIGDKEKTAKAFMAHCRTHFENELRIAIGAELAASQTQEARAS